MAALDLSSLKQYVSGAPARQVGPSTLLLDVTHNLIQRRFVEIPFDLSTSITDVKFKIYQMTGSSQEHMNVYLNGNVLLEEGSNLGQFGAKTGDFLHVEDTDPYSQARSGGFDDVSQVKKFELTDEQYNARDNTYRAYKKKMKEADPNWKSLFETKAEERRLAKQAAKNAAAVPNEEKIETLEELNTRVKVGNRCSVKPGGRRGEVKYVGPIPELANYLDGLPLADGSEPSDDYVTPTCYWIGVALDEPRGKHDGSVGGKKYFTSGYKCGVFAKPWAVEVGDFPEEDPFASDKEEDEEKKVDNANNDAFEEL